jgi:hypothetical protein
VCLGIVVRFVNGNVAFVSYDFGVQYLTVVAWPRSQIQRQKIIRGNQTLISRESQFCDGWNGPYFQRSTVKLYCGTPVLPVKREVGNVYPLLQEPVEEVTV